LTWDGVVRLAGLALDDLAKQYGGRVVAGGRQAPFRLVPVERAQAGDLAPLLSRRFARAAIDAAGRGAALLIDASLQATAGGMGAAWIHDHATWALADLLDDAQVPEAPPVTGDGCFVHPNAVLGPRVVLGARVKIGAGAVIGHPGFGWAFGAAGAVRPVPQLGGVILDDDVTIGPLCTVDAGTLAPTRLHRGVKLDAHVHVGHNTTIGEGTIVAAQCGFAGSVTIGRGVLIGGQAGFADHVLVGDGARIAAKSGVIGDVPPGATFAGYPAVPRVRWLRAFARLFAAERRHGEDRPHQETESR
jgi:UDP-3-O-[3-hydroxymyristoyl] glucosamine N-acyltransferase